MRVLPLAVATAILLVACDDGSVEPPPSGEPVRVDMVLSTVPEGGAAPPIAAALLYTVEAVEGIESDVARVLTYDANGRTYAALVLEEPAAQVPFTLLLAAGEPTPFLEVPQMVDPSNRLYSGDLAWTVEVVRE